MKKRGSADSGLRDLLTREWLSDMADERSFSRGESYFEDGQVRALMEDGGVVSAQVRGTRTYQVRLWVEDGDADASCTCPWAAEGNFCKHCVAVGLAWLAQSAESGGVGKKRGARRRIPTIDDVRAMLLAEKPEALAEMILNQARGDEMLQRRLLLKASRRSGRDLDPTGFRRALKEAISLGDFVGWDEVSDYASGVQDVLNSLGELLLDGHAGELIELTEYALTLLEKALGTLDDSDGEVGSLLEQCQELHHKACVSARPDPVELAGRLFEWEMKSEWDAFSGAAETYQDVLGETGLAEYRRRAEELWQKVPALKPGTQRESYSSRRYRITSVMEELARVSGDTDELVAVKSRDLSCAYNFLEIAEVCRAAKRRDQALDWAERGVRAFPERTDGRLREFLANEYHRRKRHDEAMELVWAEFTDKPELHRYELLKQHADRTETWPVWREKALARVREEIEKHKRERPSRTWGGSSADHSELVRIFLWEKDPDSAWHEAQAGGCSRSLWMELAAAREKEHPADAVPIYQREVEHSINLKNNAGYAAAVKLIQRIGKLQAGLGMDSEFRGYVAAVRLKHKPKRNLMKLLERVP